MEENSMKGRQYVVALAEGIRTGEKRR